MDVRREHIRTLSEAELSKARAEAKHEARKKMLNERVDEDMTCVAERASDKE